MSIHVESISLEQARRILALEEGQFADLKGCEIKPAKLTRTISAFANADGGELYVGVRELDKTLRQREWSGFADQESANGHLQCFEALFPLGVDFQYQLLRCDGLHGLVLHASVRRTQGVMKASDGTPYLRRGAQNLPANTAELLDRLRYSKGIVSFESELTAAPLETIIDSDVIRTFIAEVVPTAEPGPWLRKQLLIRDEKPSVAGVLLFADEPQAVLPKRCGIKIYRYKTKEAQGFRDVLESDPKTVEGPLYDQIKRAVELTKQITETIPKMGADSLESITYPPETLHEIVTNAVIHRDYSVADDIHVRIFDNRIEVQSPGRLPAHVTVKNILDERFARNGSIVRILNKFRDPPNKDVGEGLNTAFDAMHKLGLKEPVITETENAVLVTIRHEGLASPEEAILKYLENHESIRNRDARQITHIHADHQVKAIFKRMEELGLIEQVPGTKTGATAYRKPVHVDHGESQEPPRSNLFEGIEPGF